jgi:hypothetical protein
MQDATDIDWDNVDRAWDPTPNPPPNGTCKWRLDKSGPESQWRNYCQGYTWEYRGN